MENHEAQINGDCEIVDSKDVWPYEVTEVLLELMVEEVKKGHRVNSTFLKAGWANIKNGLKGKFKKDWTSEQLKNKFNQYRRKQRVFTSLIMETGISYIAAKGRIIASSEHWERWIKMDRIVGSIKKHGCLEYAKLCIIYGDTTATGVNAFASTTDVIDGSSEDESNEKVADVNVLGSTMDKPVELASSSKGKAKANGKKRKSAKSSFSSTIEKAIVDMATEAKLKNELRMASQANSSIGGPVNEVSSQDKELDVMTDCMKVLDDLEVDAAVFVKAFDVLHDQPLKRMLFLRMTEKRKVEWLNSLV